MVGNPDHGRESSVVMALLLWSLVGGVPVISILAILFG